MVGMSSERLVRLRGEMQRLVDEGAIAGIVTAVARHGKLVHLEALGHQNIASGIPMQEDVIFRIYSMTKPVTAVAMMILYEEGKLQLDDPVEQFIPEFAELKVAAGEDENGELVIEDLTQPMTMRQLMSYTCGLSFGSYGQSYVDRLF